MAFCSSCGREMSGNFCAACGATASGGASADYTAASAPPVAASGLTENVASALCYLFGLITGIVFLVLAPYNQNKVVRFHAFQSIFFHISLIVILIGFSIVSAMMAFLTHGLSGFLSLILYPLMGLAFFLVWLYLMYSAYTNKRVVLPVIGPLAEKQA